MGLFRRKKWKPSKKNYLKDFSYMELSTTDINNLIGYLNEKFETLHITVEFYAGRCYLYLDTPVSNYRERAVKQWFDDRSASQIEEIAISLRNEKQYNIDYNEWPSGFVDWRPYLAELSESEQKQEEEHIKMPKRIYIFHHDDHDGIFAGRIAYEYYTEKYRMNVKEDDDITGPIFIAGFVNQTRKENEYSIKTIAIEDYTVKLSSLIEEDFTKDDLLVFLDYSFSGKENQEWLKEIVEKDIPVVWIDHHQTSANVEKENAWMQKIPGVRDVRKCGTVLTYLYYCIEPFETMVPDDIGKIELPKIVDYIDSYDTWSHHLEYTEEFHYGLLVKDPMDEFFTKYPGWKEKGEVINNLIQNIIENGKSNLKFFDYENKTLHMKYSYPFSIKYRDNTYRCLAINRRGPSRMFLDAIKKYDAVCPFYFNGDKIVYSIYVDKDKNTPAGEIAEILGGGGHPKAAGFQKSYIIQKNTVLDLDILSINDVDGSKYNL